MITLTAPKGKNYFRDGFNYGTIVHIAQQEEEITFTLIDAPVEINENEQNMTLEELKQLRRLQFADMQKDFAVLFATAREALGNDNATVNQLSNLANTQRVATLQAIDNLSNVEQALAFQIREEDAKPLKDALLSLIL
jgi:hypothetical protein